MAQYLIMSAFSLYLVAYGVIALFRKDWIWKLRDFSARIEGKDKLKRDGEHVEKMNRMGNVMGVLALVLGIVGLIMNIMLMAISMNNG